MGEHATTDALVLSLLRRSYLTSPASAQHTLGAPSSLTIIRPSHFSHTTPSPLIPPTLSPLTLTSSSPLLPLQFLLPQGKRLLLSSAALSSSAATFSDLPPPSATSPSLLRLLGRSSGLSSSLALSQSPVSEEALFRNSPSSTLSSRSHLQTGSWRGIEAQPTYTHHPSISPTLQQIYESQRSSDVNNLMCGEERMLPHSAACHHVRLHQAGSGNGTVTSGREAVIITSLLTGKALVKTHSIAALTKTAKPYVTEAFQDVNSSINPPPTISKTTGPRSTLSDPCRDISRCPNPSECLDMNQRQCDNENSEIEMPWSWKNVSFIMADDKGGAQNMSFPASCLAQTNTSSSELPGCSSSGTSRAPTAASLVASEWARIVGFSLIFVVGVVGNVLVVVTLLHHRNLRTVTNVFLLNLAVSDLLLGVFCMPFTLVGSLLQDFVFGAVMCRLIPYMQAVSVSVSVWTLVAISLERFYAICQPLRSRRWQTPAHSYRVIAGVWAASLFIMTPIAALSTLMPVRGDPGRHKCREVWPSLAVERTFTVLLTATLLLVPLVVMAAAYLRVVRTLWLGAQLRAQPGAPPRTASQERSLMAKRRVVRMLFVLVAEFFICWSPLFIVNLLSLYIPRQVYAALGSFGVSLVQLLAYLSSCCNPITYCFMNANFIQSFRQTFGCPRRRPNYSFRSGYDSSFKSATAFTHTHLRVNADQPITMTQLRPNQRCPSVRHSPRTPTRHAQRQLTLSCGQGPSTASRTHSTSFTNKLLTNGATPASQTRSSSL
nr:tachykinin-like peptides receptor 99D [Procambarus clarkii]